MKVYIIIDEKLKSHLTIKRAGYILLKAGVSFGMSLLCNSPENIALDDCMVSVKKLEDQEWNQYLHTCMNTIEECDKVIYFAIDNEEETSDDVLIQLLYCNLLGVEVDEIYCSLREFKNADPRDFEGGYSYEKE